MYTKLLTDKTMKERVEKREKERELELQLIIDRDGRRTDRQQKVREAALQKKKIRRDYI